VSEIGEAEGTSRSDISPMLRLALLPPDIIEANLARRTDPGLMLEKVEQPLPAS
jgi:ParB-like chromosome segregation protein Spo0J